MKPIEGLISKIQRYSTKDGPGLRSTVFLVGCNLACQWCANPELISPDHKYLLHRDRCRQCGTCVGLAADHSIIFSGTAVEIDRARCTNLAECADSCPHDAYEQIGTWIAASELFEKLRRDKPFYDKSGGGVTFSGGEPGLQAEFVIETARLLRQAGIHIALDTAGLLLTETFSRLLDSVDLLLFDIKAYDPDLHRRCTTADNRQILANARFAAALGKPMIVRLIIVPKVNNDLADIAARMDFIQQLGPTVVQVDILKYHQLGIGKYAGIGMPYQLTGIPECSDEFAGKVLDMALSRGLQATIDG